jgi:hypothetical protein
MSAVRSTRISCTLGIVTQVQTFGEMSALFDTDRISLATSRSRNSLSSGSSREQVTGQIGRAHVGLDAGLDDHPATWALFGEVIGEWSADLVLVRRSRRRGCHGARGAATHAVRRWREREDVSVVGRRTPENG